MKVEIIVKGPAGSGKTTIVKVIEEALKNHLFDVELEGYDLEAVSKGELQITKERVRRASENIKVKITEKQVTRQESY